MITIIENKENLIANFGEFSENAITITINLQTGNENIKLYMQKETGIIIMQTSSGFEIYQNKKEPEKYYESTNENWLDEIVFFLNANEKMPIIGDLDLIDKIYYKLDKSQNIVLGKLFKLTKNPLKQGKIVIKQEKIAKNIPILSAEFDDLKDIYEFLSEIPEFVLSDYYEFEYTLYRKIIKKTGKFYFMRYPLGFGNISCNNGEFVRINSNEICATAGTFCESASAALIYSVATGEKFRGMGFAEKIVGYLTETLESEGKIPYIRCTNPAAMNLYIKMGFEKVCELAYIQ